MKVFLQKLDHLWSIITRTEFLATAFVVLSALKAQEIFPPEAMTAKVVTIGLAVLGALGYGALRVVRKLGRDKIKAANGDKEKTA